MRYAINIEHVDTCLSCYVLDHCNGDDETLIGVAVDGKSTYASVKSDLWEEICNNYRLFPEDMRDIEIRIAINALFEPVTDLSAYFDPSLENTEEDEMGDMPCAWFRFTWEKED